MKRIFVCSRADAEALGSAYNLNNIFPASNAVLVPASIPRSNREMLQDFLFIGALGYYPNQDAVRFLLDEVMPKLRAAATVPFRLVVAGTGALRELRNRLRSAPQTIWIESPERVEPLYQSAFAALAPIRAGGGTRIKALEAFSQGKLLIATAAAVSGLEVEPGIHYLRAENADEWVEGMLTAMESPTEGKRIAETAFAWVRQRGFDSTVEQIAEIVRGDLESGL